MIKQLTFALESLPAKESSQKLDWPLPSDLTTMKAVSSRLWPDMKVSSSKILQNNSLAPFSKACPPWWRSGAALLRLLPMTLFWAWRLHVLYSPECLLIKQRGGDRERWRRREQEKVENLLQHHSRPWKWAFHQASRKSTHSRSSRMDSIAAAPGSCQPADPGWLSGGLPFILMLLK